MNIDALTIRGRGHLRVTLEIYIYLARFRPGMCSSSKQEFDRNARAVLPWAFVGAPAPTRPCTCACAAKTRALFYSLAAPGLLIHQDPPTSTRRQPTAVSWQPAEGTPHALRMFGRDGGREMKRRGRPSRCDHLQDLVLGRGVSFDYNSETHYSTRSISIRDR